MGMSVAIQVVTVLIIQVASWHAPGPAGQPVQFGVRLPADLASAPAIAAARRTFRTGLAVTTVVALPAAAYAEAMGAPLGGLLAVLAMAGIDWALYAQGRTLIARVKEFETGPGPATERDDRSHWRGGLLYVNRADPRLLVPKRIGFGWTFNVAHPVAWVLLAALVAVPIIAAILGTYLR